ncbi:MAG TPA: hypothetical protein VIP46_02205 [Pyrinomonadaceae bacterium]
MKQNKSPFKWRHFEPTIILRAAQCFRSFHTAERAIEGIEALHMMRRGQVKRLDGRDSAGQAKFVASLFGVAA